MGGDTINSILIVEDNEKLALLYERWLSPTYEVTTAFTREEAKTALSPSIDLIFTDRYLVESTGDEFIDDVKESNVDCPIILLTRAKPDIEILQRGFDLYLEKPIMESELYNAIKLVERREELHPRVQEWIILKDKEELFRRQLSERRQQSSSFLEELQSYADRVEQEITYGPEELTQLREAYSGVQSSR